MPILLYTIIANFLISLGSLIGVLTLSLNRAKLNRFLLLMVALSAGGLMGGAFFHLMPEAAELLPGDVLYLLVFAAFSLFFLIEKLLHWHHCHNGHCQKHAFGQLNLIGDGIHNFIDGLIITAAFFSDVRLGLATSLAVALHEIPQEIGDFGVLLYAGFGKYKALLFNLLVGFTAIIGGIVGYFLGLKIELLMTYLLPFAAGGFIYIAASDLMPELRKETNIKKSMMSFAVFLGGVVLMYLVK